MNIADRAAMLKEIDRVIERGRFKDTWESLGQYRVPSWYRDAKFGIFIHWGVSRALPARLQAEQYFFRRTCRRKK